MWKWILAIAALFLGSLGGVAYWAQSSGAFEALRTAMDPSSKPAKVRLSPVTRGEVVRVVSAPGQIEPRTKVEISAQVSARIVEIPLRENQSVKSGDVVLRLDDRDLKAAVDSAHANHKSAQAQVQGADAEFKRVSLDFRRMRDLFETKDVSQADVEQAETTYAAAESNLKSAQFAVEIARANIQRAEKDLDNTIVRAPFDGIIVKLNAEVGELVVVGTLNNPGSVIMEIADLSTMLLKARVDEANVGSVLESQPARVFVNALPDRPLEGRVEKVGLKRLQDRDGTAYFETDILLDKPADVLLRSGMTANAEIAAERQDNILRVPSHAVLDRALDDLPTPVLDAAPWIDRTKRFVRVVFVEKDLRTVATPVRTGISDQTNTVVLEGLTEGQRIVSGPFKVLTDLKHDRAIVEDDGSSDKPAAPHPAGQGA